MLFIFIALMLAVSLACNGGSSPASPTKGPSVPNVPSNNGGSSEFVTFTDQNNLMAFEIPSDWTYENGSEVFDDGDSYYYDTFTSADGTAKIENLVYSKTTPFVAGQNGKFALLLLHNYYSNTGKEGDIRISEDSIQPDGSEKLTWTSKSGGYSGVSFFELRGGDNKTFMMLTAWWTDDSDQANVDAINAAIESYRLP